MVKTKNCTLFSWRVGAGIFIEWKISYLYCDPGTFEDENGDLMVEYDQSIIHYDRKKKLGTYHKIWAENGQNQELYFIFMKSRSSDIHWMKNILFILWS